MMSCEHHVVKVKSVNDFDSKTHIMVQNILVEINISKYYCCSIVLQAAIIIIAIAVFSNVLFFLFLSYIHHSYFLESRITLFPLKS